MAGNALATVIETLGVEGRERLISHERRRSRNNNSTVVVQRREREE